MLDPIQTLIDLALQEDIGDGDVTGLALFDHPHVEKEAVLVAKQDLIVAGIDVARKTFLTVDPQISFEALFAEGAVVKKDQVIIKLSGPIASLCKAERTAVNFLQHLSGIATQTRKFVGKVKKYKVEILDTRKTTPGLRVLEKKAVRMGEGKNHRMGLFDSILIKENHIRTCGSIEEALKRVASGQPEGKIEIEVEKLDQIPSAVTGGADIILLDNFPPKDIKKAKKLVEKLVKKLTPKRRILLEASGGITLENVVKYARTGVDRISIGALTHSSHAVDISMQVG